MYNLTGKQTSLAMVFVSLKALYQRKEHMGMLSVCMHGWKDCGLIAQQIHAYILADGPSNLGYSRNNRNTSHGDNLPTINEKEM